MKRFTQLSTLALAILVLASCNRQVTRLNPDQQVDLSGRWNDTDSKLVAEEMIQDVTGRPWHNNFKIENDRKPVVIVGYVKNKSNEHIEAIHVSNECFPMLNSEKYYVKNEQNKVNLLLLKHKLNGVKN